MTLFWMACSVNTCDCTGSLIGVSVMPVASSHVPLVCVESENIYTTSDVFIASHFLIFPTMCILEYTYGLYNTLWSSCSDCQEHTSFQIVVM